MAKINKLKYWLLLPILVVFLLTPYYITITAEGYGEGCFTDSSTGLWICDSITVVAQQETGKYGLGEAAKGLFPKTGSIENVVGNVVLYILGIVGVIFFILIIWSGLQWMLSGGNEEKITKAKKILTTATIGLIIVVLGYSITYFVIEAIEGAIISNESPIESGS